MARNPEWEPLYKAYQDFAQACLIEDRSLLCPERNLWTPANVSEIKHALVDAPALGNESFDQKLVVQMAGQPAEGWGLLADAYYLYCLVPVKGILLAKTKYTGIVSLANRGHLPLPSEHSPVWQALEQGFCHPGQRYMQKYRQFWFIFVVAEALKKAPDRRALLKDPQQFKELLDASLEKIPSPADRAPDMRHALLYLAFPDYYERSVSSGDKRSIVAAFKERLPGGVPADVDTAIYQIRQAMEKDETLPKPLDFYYPQVRSLWKNKLPTPPVMPPPSPAGVASETTLELLPLFQFTKNVIIYGPPGTGKTFVANQVARELVKKQIEVPLPEAVHLQGAAEGNTFYDLLALGMYLAGREKHFTVKEILDLPLIQARYTLRPVKNQKESIWGYLQSHTSPESKTVRVENKAEPYLFEKDAGSRWYLTATGQEYVRQNLSDVLVVFQQPTKEVGKADDFITRVAFHQSYAYEDFVEGFRPVGPNEIDVVPGKFREVCAQAMGNPGANYVLIIDEINRGNISKIFGELITLLEDDKREGQPGSFPIELAYSHLKFKVPGNLYIIGTMNTADRSIALLDVALRRRFAFYELLPDSSLLHGKIIQGENVQVDLEKLLHALNHRIGKELGADYQIGHSYFMRVFSPDALEFAWNNQILPLLKEYFYSQPERLAEVLEPFLKGLGDSSDLRREGNDLIEALAELAK